ncbi:MAG: hypothetical protein KKF44_11205 [Nanoarchaeota archaeon]|nr:hypothetical protein [Nanoarchaeota archaeon]
MKQKQIIYASMLAALSIIFQFSPFFPTTWGMKIDIVAVPWLIALFLFGFETALLSMGITTIFIGFTSDASWLGATIKFTASLVPILILGYFYKLKLKIKIHHKVKKLVSIFLDFIIDTSVVSFVIVLVYVIMASVIKVFQKGFSFFTTEAFREGIKSGYGLQLYSLLAIAGVAGAFVLVHYFSTRPYEKKYHENYFLVMIGLVISILVRGILMIYINYNFALPLWLGMPKEEIMAFIPMYMIFVPNMLQTIIEFRIAWITVFATKLQKRI